MQRSSDLYLKDILDAIDQIEEYTAGLTKESLAKNALKRDAVIWNLVIIGEAVSQLDPKVKKTHSEVPWQAIKDFRNVVVHKYHVVDIAELWDIIVNELGPLHAQISDVLEREKVKGGAA